MKIVVASTTVSDTPGIHQAAGTTIFRTFGTHQFTGSTDFNNPDTFKVAKGDDIESCTF